MRKGRIPRHSYHVSTPKERQSVLGTHCPGGDLPHVVGDPALTQNAFPAADARYRAARIRALDYHPVHQYCGHPTAGTGFDSTRGCVRRSLTYSLTWVRVRFSSARAPTLICIIDF